MKKLLTVLLTVLIAFTCVAINVSADDEDNFETVDPALSLNENVALEADKGLEHVKPGEKKHTIEVTGLKTAAGEVPSMDGDAQIVAIFDDEEVTNLDKKLTFKEETDLDEDGYLVAGKEYTYVLNIGLEEGELPEKKDVNVSVNGKDAQYERKADDKSKATITYKFKVEDLSLVNKVIIKDVVVAVDEIPSTKSSIGIELSAKAGVPEVVDKNLTFNDADLVEGKLAPAKEYTYKISLQASKNFAEKKDLDVIVNGVTLKEADFDVKKETPSEITITYKFKTPNKVADIKCEKAIVDYNGKKFVPEFLVVDKDGNPIDEKNIENIEYEKLEVTKEGKEEWKKADKADDLIDAGDYRVKVKLKNDSDYDFVLFGVASKVDYLVFGIEKAPLEASLKDDSVKYDEEAEHQNPVIVGMVDVDENVMVGEQVKPKPEPVPGPLKSEAVEESVEDEKEAVENLLALPHEENPAPAKAAYTYTYKTYATLETLENIKGIGYYEVCIELKPEIAKNYYFVDADFEGYIELEYDITDGKTVLNPVLQNDNPSVYCGENIYFQITGMDEVCHEETRGFGFFKETIIVKDYDIILQAKQADGLYDEVENIKDAGEYKIVLSLNKDAQEHFKFDVRDVNAITDVLYAFDFVVEPQARAAVDVFPYQAMANLNDTAEMCILNYENYEDETVFEIREVIDAEEMIFSDWHRLFEYEGNFLLPAGTYQVRCKADANYEDAIETTFEIKEAPYKYSFGNMSAVKGADSILMVCDYDYEITWYKNAEGRWMYEDNVKSVTINGEEIPAECYTLVKGSTEVTFNKDFTKKLNAGVYLIGLHYENGMHVEALLTIKDNNSGGSTPYVAPNTCVK